jgi:hypothetical protein
MKQKTKQIGRNQTLMCLTAQKKKVAVAVLLMGVMVIMWVRVLTRKNQVPVNETMLAAQAAVAQDTQPRIKVSYLELPRVKGRNDMPARDIFAASRWEGAGAAANGPRQSKESVRKNGNERLNDTIETIGKELKLEAIFSGKNPQASISGMLVSPAGRLAVKHEGEIYEFKAVAISDNEVDLVCKGVHVKLSMARPTNSAN